MNTTVALTKRQLQIAELIAWGATKKDVAYKLNISIRTVENTLRNIFKRTGVKKVNELSAWFFCTQFNISFDFSPFKRFIIIGLAIFTTAFASQSNINNQTQPSYFRIELFEK